MPAAPGLDDLDVRRYREVGCCVARGVFGARLIDDVVRELERTVVPSLRLFPRQSTNQRWQRHTFDGHGHIVHSMVDVHDHRTSDPWRAMPSVSYAARELLCSKTMQALLGEADGVDEHWLVQSMLFDANTATPPHHDGYYLDGRAPEAATPDAPAAEGAIIGAWIALEDIHEDAGRFFVTPGRDTRDALVGGRPDASHEAYLARCRTLFEERRTTIFAPALRAGDVVLWSSSTLHGALPTRDPSRSRRSLNGHFLPAGAHLGSWLQVPRSTEAMTFHRHGDVRWNARNYVAPKRTLLQLARGALARMKALV